MLLFRIIHVLSCHTFEQGILFSYLSGLLCPTLNGPNQFRVHFHLSLAYLSLVTLAELRVCVVCYFDLFLPLIIGIISIVCTVRRTF